jgi:hypothetical protein
MQARHNGLPKRVYLRYGLVVHLQLLPTPPRGDAVTFGYRVPEHPDKDFHLADSFTVTQVAQGGEGGFARALALVVKPLDELAVGHSGDGTAVEE